MKHFACLLFLQVTLSADVEPRILQTVVSETAREPRLERLLRELVGGGDVVERYYCNRVDLDNDGTPESIAMAAGQYICGSAGCPTFISRKSQAGYTLVADLELSKAPIYRVLGYEI